MKDDNVTQALDDLLMETAARCLQEARRHYPEEYVSLAQHITLTLTTTRGGHCAESMRQMCSGGPASFTGLGVCCDNR